MTIDIGEAADATNSVAHCPDWLVRLLEMIQTVSDLVGLTAICGAFLIASGRWLFHEAKLLKNRGDRMERWMGIREIRLFLGNYILFGLEFMIVSDIIHSFLQPDLQSLSRLWRDEKNSRLSDDRGKGLNSAAVFDAMNRAVQDDAIIAVDVGNNTYSFGRYFEASGKQAVLMSGYLGSIGFGFPAAMGAWSATTEEDTGFFARPVWCVTGDGGFGQYMMEVLTAVKYGMNITHVLLHNDELGKISKEQKAGELEVWKTGLHNPNFADYAELCGAKGIRVESADDLDGALAAARDHNGPALVEVMTDPLLV